MTGVQTCALPISLDRNEVVTFPGVLADSEGNPTDQVNNIAVVKGGDRKSVV